jgi:hypothetical protein
VDHDGRFARRDIWSWVAAVAGLMCSGVGITMVAIVFVFSLFRRGWRTALTILSVPAVTYLIWYGAIGHTGTARDSFESTQFLSLPAYVWTGLTAAWEGAFGIPNSGALILAALTVPLLVHGARDRATQLAIAGLAGSVFLLLQSGALRISHGIDQAASSRYAYIAVALGLPALAWLVDQLVQRSRGANPAAVIALALVCLLLIVNGGSQLRSFAISREGTTTRQQSLTIGTEALIQRGERTFNTAIDSHLIPDVTTRRLADPDVRHAFGTVAASRSDIVNASGLTQVIIGPASHGLPAPQRAQWEGVRARPRVWPVPELSQRRQPPEPQLAA